MCDLMFESERRLNRQKPVCPWVQLSNMSSSNWSRTRGSCLRCWRLIGIAQQTACQPARTAACGGMLIAQRNEQLTQNMEAISEMVQPLVGRIV